MPQPIKAYLGAVPLFDAGQSSAGYQRPEDWLPLPAAEAESVKILNAVFDQEENYTALRMIVGGGGSQYQVDWGDGVVEIIASNVDAVHNYDFNDPALYGTLSSRGYKQAVIKVTPVSGVFTFMTLNVKVASPSGQQYYASGFLDININTPSITSGVRFLIGGVNTVGVRHSYLERCNITSFGGATILQRLFEGCHRLQSVNETEWDLSQVTSMTTAFSDCRSLQSLNCSNWNISNVSLWTSAFQNCQSLRSFVPPTGTFPAGTTFRFLFNVCSSLRDLDLSGWNVVNAVSTEGMFANCASLQRVNLTGWDTSSVTNAANMFNVSVSLREIPALNLANVTTLGNFANSCHSLTSVGVTGIDSSVSMTNCRLGATALNEIYTNLSANGTGKTITVSGNYGTASDNPSIAIAKGWTVTG